MPDAQRLSYNHRMTRLLALAAVAVIAVAPAASAMPAVYANCTNLHRTYPHGLGQTTAHDHVTSGRPVTNFTKNNARFADAMRYNKGLDRDHDHIACEAH